MLSLGSTARIFLAVEPTDLRKSYDGLSGLVERDFEMDPASGDCFVFMNRRQTQVRILYWDRDGFCILMKRLERGTFRRSTTAQGQLRIEIDAGDLALLLEGIDASGAKRSKRYRKARELSHIDEARASV
mgnify:CR=1 FL=1